MAAGHTTPLANIPAATSSSRYSFVSGAWFLDWEVIHKSSTASSHRFAVRLSLGMLLKTAGIRSSRHNPVSSLSSTSKKFQKRPGPPSQTVLSVLTCAPLTDKLLGGAPNVMHRTLLRYVSLS